tara:strand:- start:139 stop:444 length:306 start_codon:yes stop_codon:yes gene_type:complete
MSTTQTQTTFPTNEQQQESCQVSLRAFSFKYLGPTNKKGSRIAIIDKRFGKRKVISWDYELSSAMKNAAAYLRSIGYEIIGGSDDENVIITRWATICIKGG